MKSGGLLLGLGVCSVLAGGIARADDAAAEFGRVSAVTGSVQIQAAAGTDWSAALVNEPVTAGTNLRSSRGADAELSLPGARIALGGSSETGVLRLDRETIQIAVSRGRIGLHLDPAAHNVEIDLPAGGVWLSGPGDYDITASETQSATRIAVLAGTASIGGGLADENVVAATDDTFSDWRRSQGIGTEAIGDSHLAPGLVGAAALEAYGTWKSDATYGAVWYPNDVADDWAPFRDGVWRFLPPAGWTWVDKAAWGFTPSHYGRWARIDDRWAWVPPAKDSGPDYSPARVAFLGTAPIGLSCPGNIGPAVAWFPLAPGETVGDGNEEIYRNRRFAAAVPRATFAGGKPVATALVDLPEQRFADAPVILGPLGIAPTGSEITAAKGRPVVVVAAAPRVTVPLPARKPVLAGRLVARLRLARKQVALAAIAITARAHAVPSTGSARSTHTRQHLAAARGGAL